jgi:hypothetical protein
MSGAKIGRRGWVIMARRSEFKVLNVRVIPRVLQIDPSKYQNPTKEAFRQAMIEIEAMGPMSPTGRSIPDEELTSDALYRDYA